MIEIEKKAIALKWNNRYRQKHLLSDTHKKQIERFFTLVESIEYIQNIYRICKEYKHSNYIYCWICDDSEYLSYYSQPLTWKRSALHKCNALSTNQVLTIKVNLEKKRKEYAVILSMSSSNTALHRIVLYCQFWRQVYSSAILVQFAIKMITTIYVFLNSKAIRMRKTIFFTI